MSNKLSAGEFVATNCTKCKLEVGHTIMAMVGDKIVRVKCRSCGSEHNYKDMTKKTALKKIKAAGTKKSKPVKSPERLWEEAIGKVKTSEITYNGESVYKSGEALAHPIFGSGVVLETLSKKIRVIFRDKERLLVSAN